MALGPFSEPRRPPVPLRRSASAVRTGAWRALVAPERPKVAVEIRPSGVGVVRTRREGRALVLEAAAAVELAPDVLRPSLTQPNIGDREILRSALRSAIKRAGVLDGTPIALVLPDPVARVALIPAEELTSERVSELDEVVRFRLRKSLPFDAREARVAHVRSPRAQDPVLVVAAMSSVIDSYEEICRSLGLEPGLVELSGLTLCRYAFGANAPGDHLLVNWDDGYATFLLVRDGWPVLARTLTGPMVSSPAEVAREAAQTLVYARERLGSLGLTQVLVRACGLAAADAAAVLETPLGVAPEMVEPWRALGTADPGPAAQALAGAAACVRSGRVKPANLARHPFVNERLPNLVFAVAAVLMLGLTVRHAFLIHALLPGRTSALHNEVTRLEEESKHLRSEQASLRGLVPEPKALARWVVIKELVDRRAFSWTGLFARLEESLPEGARLVSITPGLHRGEIMLDVLAVVRSPEVGWLLVRVLEEDGAFDEVFPLSEGEEGEFHYTMRYRPRAPRPPSAPAAAVAPPGNPSPDEDPSPTAVGAASTPAPEARP